MNLESMLGRARKGLNNVLDDLSDYTPKRLRHTFAAGSMLFMLYLGSGCGGSSGGGSDGGGDNPPANKPPVVSATFNPVSLQEDTTTSVSAAGHFSDPEGKPLTYSASGYNANVHVDVNGGQLNIWSEPDYNGTSTG